MKYKSCITCIYYNEDSREDFKESVAIKATCMHELSQGRTTREMVFNGPCEHKLYFWKRRKYQDFEAIRESD